MQRIFISDLHLEHPQDLRSTSFAQLLAHESHWADELYILGDLVEMWIGDDDDSELAMWLTEQLRACACEVYLMHGNRDFLFAEHFARSAGLTLLPDPFVTDDGFHLTHGDSLCTDDAEYQQMRSLLRSDAWQQDILGRSLAERKAFGDGLRAQSRAANANKATNIMDINAQAFAEAMQTSACHTMIHGHTHRPGVHQSAPHTRYVLGAWERCGWLIRQQHDALQLECFSLARHYGT